jgi:hypothetical protein
MTVQRVRWKQYIDGNYALGIRFSYPPDWTASEGNAGPLFTSPDKKMMLSLSGPYENTIDKLAHQDTAISRVASKTSTIILHHRVIRQTLLTPNRSKFSRSITAYIGDVKEVVHFGNGPTEQLSLSLVLTMTITDNAQYDQASKIFNQILSTIKFMN